MTRIHLLDPRTADGIAAGEVIERPASVVKELIDNALDAHCSRIDIELENGGRQLIQVSDNGCGMYADDVPLALQRYSTSKINQLDDLQKLTTLGFRGEALASLVAMAEVEIYTRPHDCPTGVVGIAKTDRPPTVHPMGSPLGTRVCVHHLFRHVPVRLRALRAVSREVRYIQELVAHYALAHPSVTFNLRHDGRRLLFSQACNSVLQRAPQVLSGDLASQLIPVTYDSVDIRIDGCVAPSYLSRSSRQRQYIWINGRPVRYLLLNHAVERLYAGLLPQGRHPVFALGLSVSPAMIDVNIHPRKVEVKLLHERAVFAAVQEAVAACLDEVSATFPVATGSQSDGDWASFAGRTPAIAEPQERYASTHDAREPSALQPLGQLANTYIVAQDTDGLLLLDQHAAHEALLYDALLMSSTPSVALDDPIHLNLAQAHLPWLDTVLPILLALNFDMHRLGKQVVAVHGVPAALQPFIQTGNILEALEEAHHRLQPNATPEEIREQLSAAFACRTAIRAGDVLDNKQRHHLVDAVGMGRMAYACPHGRPTYLTLTIAELERRFLRFFST